MLIITAVAIYPLLYSLWVSLHNINLANPNLTTGFAGVGNYVKLFQDTAFWHAIKLTGVFVVVSVILSLAFGLGLAVLLDMEGRLMRVVRSVMLIPMCLTPVVVGIIWRMMYNPEFGVINYLLRLFGLKAQEFLGSTALAFPAVIVVDVWQWTPFIFLILFAGLRSLPQSPFEAAQVDGASSWQVLRYVTLPLMKPVILIAVLLRALDAVRVFDQVFVLTRGGPAQATDLFSIFIYRVGFRHFHTGYAAAISWVFMLMLLALSIVFVRALFSKRRQGVRA